MPSLCAVACVTKKIPKHVSSAQQQHFFQSQPSYLSGMLFLEGLPMQLQGLARTVSTSVLLARSIVKGAVRLRLHSTYRWNAAAGAGVTE